MTILLILPHYRELQYFSGVYLNLRQFINIQLSGIWLIIDFEFIHKISFMSQVCIGYKSWKIEKI